MRDSGLAAVGDHFLVGLRPGTLLDAQDRSLLEDLRPGGVIIYKSNFAHDRSYADWLDSHEKLIAEIRDACGRDRLFIAIDHEGGRVCRTPPPISRFTYASRWGEAAGPVGGAMGRELASLGINLNFAPVLDVDSNPNNPVIGDRALGRSPEDVAIAAVSMMQTMEAEGVRACGKHFPGHGDTTVDSHVELPLLDATIDSLWERELRPFLAAIEAGIEMIMTSHILFPAIDPEWPATLSHRITHELLRSELKFGGVVVSDDIGMHAMDGFFGNPRAAVDCLTAGTDMLMICSHLTDTERARAFAREIVLAQTTGELDRTMISDSKERIHKMLESTEQNEVVPLSEDVFAAHQAIAPLYAAETVEVV